jgi:hypothetical protein
VIRPQPRIVGSYWKLQETKSRAEGSIALPTP